MENVEEKIDYWMSFSPKEAKYEFERQSLPFIEYVLGQPKIQTLLDI